MQRITLRAASIVTVVFVLWGTSAAGAATGSHGLRWHSPRTVASGVPLEVASIQPCPPVPTPGDTTLVSIQLNFSGGASGTTIGVNPDRSWAADVTFGFVPTSGPATLSATCVDFNGHGGTPYANYKTHTIRVVH